MRHLKAGKRLGVTTSHRRAMMRNLVTSLIEHEQITCTLTRAKEMRKPLDKMITLGKRGNLHARRQALKFIKSKAAMEALFGELAERYKDRNGGYSRIIKLGKRRLGDGAEMAIIQLIDSAEDVLSDLKEKSTAKKAKSAPKETVLDEMSQELSTDKGTEETTSEETTTKAESEDSSEKATENAVGEETAAKAESDEQATTSENTSEQSSQPTAQGEGQPASEGDPPKKEEPRT